MRFSTTRYSLAIRQEVCAMMGTHAAPLVKRPGYRQWHGWIPGYLSP
ncbi:hypothetical protein ACLB1M_18095 [Escherichia coli]